MSREFPYQGLLINRGLYDLRMAVSRLSQVKFFAWFLRQAAADWVGRRGYEAREATPLRMPTERSTRSASARMRNGESLSAGIIQNSVTPSFSASSRASILISC